MRQDPAKTGTIRHHRRTGGAQMQAAAQVLRPAFTDGTLFVSSVKQQSVNHRMAAVAERKYLYKTVIIGGAGAGKSSVLIRYADDTFNKSAISTIGVDFKVKELKCHGKTVKLQIWDTAGQERFRTISMAYYRGASAILVVYDVTSAESFAEAKEFHAEATAAAGDKAAVFVFGNKSDLAKDGREVSTKEGEAFAAGAGACFLEGSAKTGTGIEEAFETLTKAKLSIDGHLSGEDAGAGGDEEDAVRAAPAGGGGGGETETVGGEGEGSSGPTGENEEAAAAEAAEEAAARKAAEQEAADGK